MYIRLLFCSILPIAEIAKTTGGARRRVTGACRGVSARSWSRLPPKTESLFFRKEHGRMGHNRTQQRPSQRKPRAQWTAVEQVPTQLHEVAYGLIFHHRGGILRITSSCCSRLATTSTVVCCSTHNLAATTTAITPHPHDIIIHCRRRQVSFRH